jgi:hypothetical protein
MAEKKTTTTVELDGNQLVSALQKAGLDPTKLDLKETLGPRVDIQELQSRLHSAGKAAASHWHVNVTVTVSRD